jgi:hypothetical protein
MGFEEKESLQQSRQQKKHQKQDHAEKPDEIKSE